jgi:hypothetical protein
MENMLPMIVLFGVLAMASLVVAVRRGWLNPDGVAGKVAATTRKEVILVFIAACLVAALFTAGWLLASFPALTCGIAALAAGR